MKREIVINASALEVRVALLEDGSLTELYLERQQHRGLAGNIYKGKVTRVLPGMQAAFVESAWRRRASCTSPIFMTTCRRSVRSRR